MMGVMIYSLIFMQDVKKISSIMIVFKTAFSRQFIQVVPLAFSKDAPKKASEPIDSQKKEAHSHG